MIKITLSSEEKTLLKGYLKACPLVLIRYIMSSAPDAGKRHEAKRTSLIVSLIETNKPSDAG